LLTKIRAARHLHGMTAGRLASELGYCQQWLIIGEKRRRVFRSCEQEVIGRVLGVDPGRLFDTEGMAVLMNEDGLARVLETL